jgi:L-lactate dehydrogenase complex protein LldE
LRCRHKTIILNRMRPVRPKIGLFVTCLVDAMRPSIGFAAAKLLSDAGCEVVVPRAQTCCGQPAYNSGDSGDARALAQQVITAFASVDFVVVPSGSCGGTIKVHYPEMFADDPGWRERAEHLAARTYELTTFLADVLQAEPAPPALTAKVAYHDSCSGLRELGIREQPRRLLSRVSGLEIAELANRDACCGFGGLFCVKYPEISRAMVDAKVDDIVSSGADTVLGGDLGCLLNIAGRLSRRELNLKVRHVAEVLAGDMSARPIGWGEDEGGR